MHQHGGIGIAANQCGHEASIIIVEDTVMINPSVQRNSTWGDTQTEGCLSVPGKIFNVWRITDVIASYINQRGESCKENMSGLRARVFQHELDHLNGITLANNPAATEIVQQIY